MQSTRSGPGNGFHDVRSESGGGPVQEKAQEVAGQAQEKAQEVAGQAKGRAQQLIDERSTQLGQQVSTQAGDLRSVGETLRQQGKDGPAKVADRAAERAERLGSYLSESDADRMLGDVEDFARKNTWAVALGGFALGFAASRFLKASSRQRYEQRGPRAPGQLPAHAGARPGYRADAGLVPPPAEGTAAPATVSPSTAGTL